MKDVENTFRVVLRKKSYLVLLFSIFVFWIIVNALIINKGAVGLVITTDYIKFSSKVSILWHSFLNTWVLISTMEKIFLLIIAILVGYSITILSFYIKRRITGGAYDGKSFFGILVSLLGVGCASCGSVILSSLLGLSAAGAVIGFLPLNGIEFLIISIALLCWSIYNVSKKIQNPALCKIS